MTRTMKHWISLLALACFLGLAPACSRQKTATLPPAPMADRPKNIILLIGDGMALAQASAGVYWAKQQSSFEKFPVVGFHKSHSHDDLVTDSAAGATAFSCGKKTTNSTIGMTADGQPCRTILEDLDERGWATGMVVTCSATHATPASFIAHREIRAFTDDIALDFLKTPLDCFIGGGEAYFNDRLDLCNLEDSLKLKKYVVRSGTRFNRLPLDGSAPFMLFTAQNEPGTASAGRTYLPKATRVAAEYLKKRSKTGFFMVVEGSQIDWACHANDRNWLKAEMLDFDKTINQALEFAAADGETLVLVTGDHECGALSLNKGTGKRDFRATFGSKLHTAALVPVYAFGPQADIFSGIYQNTALHTKMLDALGLGSN